jgi:hypothetical protein
VRIKGLPPLGATVYALEKLRCNLCGTVFTAKAPPGIGEKKYDETAVSMIGLLKFAERTPLTSSECTRVVWVNGKIAGRSMQVGCGSIARMHAAALHKVPSFLVAIMSSLGFYCRTVIQVSTFLA